MNLKKSIFLIGLAWALFLSFPFLFFLNKNLAYYAYKEVTYRVIINHLIGKEKKEEKIASTLLDYFYYDLFTPTGAQVIDKDLYNDLMRGIAWCDQRSLGIGTFLGKVGIGNRIVITRNPNGISNHTISEVLIEKKWVALDPTLGLLIRDGEGKLLSYMDICKEPSLFYLSPKMFMLKEINPQKYGKVKESFTTNIFYNSPSEPTIWSNPIKTKDLKRKVITGLLDFYINIFKDTFSYIYQDIYLVFYSPFKENERIYFKARNYDLYNRYTLAEDLYREFILRFPEDNRTEKARFLLGLLENKNKNFELSISTLEMLLKKYPNTKWKRIAIYYLGYNYELLKNYELAKDYYWKAIYLYNELSQDDLKPGELKAVKRLYDILNLKK